MSEVIQPSLARSIEASLVRPEVSRQDIEQLCAEARDFGCYGVRVNGSRVLLAAALLEETGLKVTSLVGYPLGATDSDVKRYETEVAIDHGAHEIELMANLGPLKDGEAKAALREMRDIVEAADERAVTILLQTQLLTPSEITLACELALDSGARAIGIITGIGLNLPSLNEVKDLRKLVGDKFGIKAVGEMTSAANAQALLAAGANRLGLTGFKRWETAETSSSPST